ncbi:unnamed protein product [Calicophoron daubneyi]|uniref:Chromo domain-containing protein n=1 Tax=Calicophoron daubneyi TaxID=300641 RepID=A0AAV2T1T2_CALDB
MTEHEPPTENDKIEFEVEELVDVRYVNGEAEYLIKWKNHSPDMNTWEPESNLHCPLLLRKFLAQRTAPQTTVVDVPESNECYGFNRGLAPDFINMVTKKDDELYFLIKWYRHISCTYLFLQEGEANMRCCSSCASEHAVSSASYQVL